MANLAWGACLLIDLIIAAFFSPLLALLLSPLLAIPLVGVFRLGAIIARGEPPDFADVTAAWGRYAGPALLLGASLVFAATVLIVDAVGAASSGSTVAWILATLAGWGMLGVGTFALIAWPILVDPRREQMGAAQRLRLAGLMLAAFPGRMVGLAIICGVILLASTIAFAALISISLAFVALLACRYVLPAADRLEARLNRVAGEADQSQDVGE